MKMPAEHRFLKFVLPAFLFEALKAGTRTFLLECPCGHKRDLWDAGGVKGGGTKQVTYARCPECGKRTWQKKRKKTEEEKRQLDPAQAVEKEMSTYPTKRDWWLMAILWGMTVFMIYIAFTVHKEPAAPWMQLFASYFFGFFALLMIALTRLAYTTSYSLDPVNLTINVGPFRYKIPIAEITEAYPTWNPLSSPAWSLDRLRIRFTSHRFGALISPVRKMEFLQELGRLAPHLHWNGERLTAVN